MKNTSGILLVDERTNATTTPRFGRWVSNGPLEPFFITATGRHGHGRLLCGLSARAAPAPIATARRGRTPSPLRARSTRGKPISVEGPPPFAMPLFHSCHGPARPWASPLCGDASLPLAAGVHDWVRRRRTQRRSRRPRLCHEHRAEPHLRPVHLVDQGRRGEVPDLHGCDSDRSLGLGQAVFEPTALRVTSLSVTLGGPP